MSSSNTTVPRTLQNPIIYGGAGISFDDIKKHARSGSASSSVDGSRGSETEESAGYAPPLPEREPFEKRMEIKDGFERPSEPLTKEPDAQDAINQKTPNDKTNSAPGTS